MNRQLLTQQSQQPVVHPINGEQQYRYGNNQVYKRGANFNVAVQRKKNNHITIKSLLRVCIAVYCF